MHHELPLSISSLLIQRNDSFRVSIPELSLKPGGRLCLTGTNGSGKTTLIEAIVGLLEPNLGIIRINGQIQSVINPIAKEGLGYIPDDDGWIIPELTGDEYIRLIASIHTQSDCLKEAARLSAALSFNAAHQQAGSLSHGNRKKLQIITALMHNPRLIVVDELRNGLDPIAIKVAEDLLIQKAAEGAAVVAASHDLWWSERFADTIVIMQDGDIKAQANTADIIKDWGSLEALFFSHHE